MRQSTDKHTMSRRGFLWVSALWGGAMLGGRLPWAQRRFHTLAGSGLSLQEDLIPLPAPALDGDMALERVLSLRRSVRAFTNKALTMQQLAQLLWAAQGITSKDGKRTVPSAMASYPLDAYVVENDKKYHYLPDKHALALQLTTKNLQRDLSRAAAGQNCVATAPVVFVLTSQAARVRSREEFGIQEIGHAAQNLLLQTVALGLGAVPVGGMDRTQVQEVLQLPDGHVPYTLIPVGYPA